MHILVVHDGTDGADEAARFVTTLAPQLDARVTIAAVSAPLVPDRRTHAAAEHTDESVRAHGLPSDVVTVEGATVGAVASSIVDRLDAPGADDVDLIVVGDGRPDLLARLAGSPVRRFLRRSPTPVLVVGEAPVALRRMLLCTSLQLPDAGAALAPAIRIAAATGADVEVLHVMSQLPGNGDSADVAAQSHGVGWHREHATPEGRHLDAVLELLAAHGVGATARIRHGLVVDEIVAEARAGHADLVVLGAHGQGDLVSRLLENITEKVVDELDRPVLVLRGAERPDP